MQPQLLTIIVIIVILYVIQHTSNRIIVKESLGLITDPKRWTRYLTRDETDEVDKLCEKGYYDYFLYRFNHPFYYNHEKALSIGQRNCQYN